jgi:hypothetical protein
MKKYLKYIITTGIGILMCVGVILIGDISNQESISDVMKILTNAFFVPGILILGFGLLILASNGGTFDMLSYGTKKFFDLFRRPQYRKITDTFYDYRKAKQENPIDFMYMIFIGLGFLVISVVFLVLYYQV